jgi:hypothetical protein
VFGRHRATYLHDLASTTVCLAQYIASASSPPALSRDHRSVKYLITHSLLAFVITFVAYTTTFHSSRTSSDAAQHHNTRLTCTDIIHKDRIRIAIKGSRRTPTSNAEDRTSSISWTRALRNHSHIVLPCHYHAGITSWTLVFKQTYTPNEMAGQGAGPSRRSHTKSRKGCKTCKRRHIRCDETFPQWCVCLCGDWSAVETDGYAAVTARSTRSAAITWRAWDQIPKAKVEAQNSTHSPSPLARRVV